MLARNDCLLIKLVALLLTTGACRVAAALNEEDRLVEYHKRNYTWPVETYLPNTEGWRNLMESRLHQVEEIENSGERYEGFIQTMRSAILVPNFTEHGFGLARCPQDLLEALQQGIHDGFDDRRLEGRPLVMDGPPAWFVSRPDLTKRALHELEHYAETWANMSLTPYIAYGFRLYRNESALFMHVDKMETHIISFILHIDSSDDAEPWPIFIEDLKGQTHEVILTPGDMLFYESSKCWHGRPKPFRGTWYTSLFVHYYPSDGWFGQNHKNEAHYAVPPQWINPPPAEKRYTKLEMRGTGIAEPDCPNQWCRSMESIKWSGPGEEGFWIAPTGEKYPFHPKHVDYKEEL
ncbi:hypothetical protein ACA910_008573 [Epithemia clementina (nom. ined.)]